MSEFARAVDDLVDAETGIHRWNTLRHEHLCEHECGLPKGYDEAREAIEQVREKWADVLVVALRRFDMSRIMLEAQQRHLSLDHEDDPVSAWTLVGGAYAGFCDQDIVAAMLRDDEPGYRVEWEDWTFPDSSAAWHRLRARYKTT